MPNFIKTKKDEEDWQSAQKAFAKSKGHAPSSNSDWGLVTTIYKKIQGKEMKESVQSLFSAGDLPPSEKIKKYGKCYGFVHFKFAEAWRKKNNFKHVYQFFATEYDIDKKVYVRDSTNGKEISDTEYIVYAIQHETIVESHKVSLKNLSEAAPNKYQRIADAIKNKHLMEVMYRGTEAKGSRIIEPYVIGTLKGTANMAIRCFQLNGDTSSEQGWKLLLFDDIYFSYANKFTQFEPRSDYVPRDSDFIKIDERVKR